MKGNKEWIYRRGRKLIRVEDALENCNWFIKFGLMFSPFPRFFGVYKEFVDVIDDNGKIRRIWVKEGDADVYGIEEYK